VFETALCDSVVFLVVETIFSTFHANCAYGSAYPLSHPNYMELSCILAYPRLSFRRFGWVWICL